MPTLAPSYSPVQPPTNAPSFSPTIAPTQSPTHHQTEWIYEDVILIDYNITNITSNISDSLYSSATVQEDVEKLIEFVYLFVSRTVNPNDSSQHLHYRDYDLQIENVFTSADHHSATLQSKIYYANDTGVELRYFSRLTIFRIECKRVLQKYFNYTALDFIVGKDVEEDDNLEELSDFNIFPWAIAVILSICVIVAFASFIYNNCVDENESWTDNGNSIALPLYGLQMVDVLSDINLCLEIFLQFDDQNSDKTLLYIAGWGSLIFTFVPYVCNVVFAASIRNFSEVQKNTFAKSYFQKTSWFFIVLVVFCGGVYPALSIVSSRLFAFEFLNSGLSGMELTKLTKLRMFGTVCLENIPQLIFSSLYVTYRGKPSQNSILSMIFSVLQIIATVVNWIVNCRSSDCKIFQYDLEMIVSEKPMTTRMVSTGEVVTESDEESSEFDDSKSPVTPMVFDMRKSFLSQEQKNRIRQKKERKASLRRWLCTELGLRLNCIEIGYITLTPKGCIVRILHSTFDSELNRFGKANVKKDKSESNEVEQLSLKHKAVSADSVDFHALSPTWNRTAKKIKKTAKSLFKDIYREHKHEVNCAFASHFGLKLETVTVNYWKKYPYSKWDLANKTNFSYRQISCLNESDVDIIENDNKYGSGQLNNAAVCLQVPRPSQTGNSTVPSQEVELSKDVIQNTPTPELSQGLDQIKQITKVLRNKLAKTDPQQAREELVKEGYDGNLLDTLMECVDIGMRKQLSVMTSHDLDESLNEDDIQITVPPMVTPQSTLDLYDSKLNDVDEQYVQKRKKENKVDEKEANSSINDKAVQRVDEEPKVNDNEKKDQEKIKDTKYVKNGDLKNEQVDIQENESADDDNEQSQCAMNIKMTKLD